MGHLKGPKDSSEGCENSLKGGEGFRHEDSSM
jgi:hypothetical protein